MLCLINRQGYLFQKKKKKKKKYSPRRIKLHIFSKISCSVACPLSCVQLISLFLYEKTHFFIQNAIKIYTKTHQLSRFQKIFESYN